MSSKDQIEFGDASERMSHIIGQNKELKELVIMKESQISQLKADNTKMEKELQNIMDPLSKNSQLKTVNLNNKKYKETLTAKETKISDLERENHQLKKDLREANQRAKEVQSKLESIDSRNKQAMYDLRLELEEKARKQMVISSNQESYARELSITYTNIDGNDAAKKVKESAEGIMKENKQLKAKIADYEKMVSQHNIGVSHKTVLEDLESSIFLSRTKY